MVISEVIYVYILNILFCYYYYFLLLYTQFLFFYLFVLVEITNCLFKLLKLFPKIITKIHCKTVIECNI